MARSMCQIQIALCSLSFLLLLRLGDVSESLCLTSLQILDKVRELFENADASNWIRHLRYSSSDHKAFDVPIPYNRFNYEQKRNKFVRRMSTEI